MSRIENNLLNDTLSLVQLARETALLKGNQAQAQKLTPVVDDLRSLVSSSRNTKTEEVKPSGMLAQKDFQTLLSKVQNKDTTPLSSSSSATIERNQFVLAMSNGGMTDIEIARQMGMATEEIQMILSLNQAKTRGR